MNVTSDHTTVDRGDRALKTVDELLAALRHSDDHQALLVGEHLRAARNSRLGSMPQEYTMNVDLARSAAGLLKDRSLRERVVSRSTSLLKDEKTTANNGRRS